MDTPPAHMQVMCHATKIQALGLGGREGGGICQLKAGFGFVLSFS